MEGGSSPPPQLRHCSLSRVIGLVLNNGILHGMLPTKCHLMQSVSLLHAYHLSHGELLNIVSYRTNLLVAR